MSCTKDEVARTTPGGTSTVQVEYRNYAASGSASVVALLPEAGQQGLSEQHYDMNRVNYSSTFEVTSGTAVSIKAKNANPGSEEVIAEIYVNGTLLVSGNANAPGHYATASGIAK
jgi:hypothetical protein